MDISYSEFRQHLKQYMDLLLEKETVIKVTRQRGGDAFIISEEQLAKMTTKEFKELQKRARLTKYAEKMYQSDLK